MGSSHDSPEQETRNWLAAAIQLSRLSPPSPAHYAVGAIIVSPAGNVLADGYTSETDDHDHAEEAALGKVGRRADLVGATMYSSLEPCTMRRSRPITCVDLILSAGVSRVVFAMREPLLLADCRGAETLHSAGVEVVELPEFGSLVAEVNAHLLGHRQPDTVRRVSGRATRRSARWDLTNLL